MVSVGANDSFVSFLVHAYTARAPSEMSVCFATMGARADSFGRLCRLEAAAYVERRASQGLQCLNTTFLTLREALERPLGDRAGDNKLEPRERKCNRQRFQSGKLHVHQRDPK